MREELNIGDEVYYSLEDYNSGEDVIYKGYVVGIDNDCVLKLKDTNLKLSTFYQVSDKPGGEMMMGMQRNCLYTLKDLFNIKDKYEEISREV